MGRRTGNIDWITVTLLILLASFGLFLLVSTDKSLFYQQAIYLVIGILFLLGVSRLERDFLWWFAPIGYVFSICLLLLSYTGPAIRGATRWIMIGNVQLQPSELVKPLLILAFSWCIHKFPPRNLRNIFLLSFVFSLPFVLVFKQPDLGTSIIYAAFFIAMLIAGGLDIRLLVVSMILVAVTLPTVGKRLAPYQQNRLLTFLNPNLDPKGAGYNALQATIAIGSGLFIGRGLGFGTQSHLRFLPEYHTDFIFASLVEELGFLGGILLLSIYAILLWRILTQTWQLRDDVFQFVFSIGIFAMLLSQVFINTGMNMGIMPITGITLPFVSYGGSSLISLSITFGLFWAVISGKSRSDGIAIT